MQINLWHCETPSHWIYQIIFQTISEPWTIRWMPFKTLKVHKSTTDVYLCGNHNGGSFSFLIIFLCLISNLTTAEIQNRVLKWCNRITVSLSNSSIEYNACVCKNSIILLPWGFDKVNKHTCICFNY